MKFSATIIVAAAAIAAAKPVAQGQSGDPNDIFLGEYTPGHQHKRRRIHFVRQELQDLWRLPPGYLLHGWLRC
ncbi:hypothetical protein PT974_10825 [Cladobotryum mycophilum]|uniref:Uncharacterized protein n=1 Tax=Cladobotryum mycophilum TaxID=491253 RepID=A0ABR0SBY2_9HYPO